MDRRTDRHVEGANSSGIYGPVGVGDLQGSRAVERDPWMLRLLRRYVDSLTLVRRTRHYGAFPKR